jgi:hypothetical protein
MACAGLAHHSVGRYWPTRAVPVLCDVHFTGGSGSRGCVRTP